MCGFVGSFGADVSREEISAALALLAHRGPDARQVIKSGPLCLGSCRLAVVAPEQAPPVHFPSDRQVLVLNGEVYDLEPHTLVAETAPAVATTDTERLGLLLREHGTRALPDLRGLFAFCWLDGNRLLLVRDRFGIKPLYHAHYRQGLLFASEMKALLSLPGFSRELDEDVMSAFRVVGHNVFPGRTPFRRIRAVRPGHLLECREGGRVRELPFAPLLHVPPAGQGRCPDPDAARAQVEDLLAASVRRAARHDPHPKAVFFSGGLDSSLLLDLARAEAPTTAFVLSDRSDAPDFVEARRVAAALDVPLREQLIDELDLAREIVHYAWHFEHPIVGGAFDLLGGVAFHALARCVGREFRVAFCGEGADELFLGYHRLHVEPQLVLEAVSRRAGERATPSLREWLKAQGLAAGTAAPFNPPAGPAAWRALRDLALHQGLSEYHLPSVDRSGMAFGLEIRPPFLDNDLAELAAGLDEAVLLDRVDYWTKRPLRAVARRRFRSPGTERVAVRRKRAMSSSVEVAAKRLLGLLPGTSPGVGIAGVLEPLLAELFEYLHVDPGITDPPDFSLVEFAAELGSRAGAR